MYQQTMGIPNVALWPKMCHCGNLHLKVTAVRPIPARTPLIVELKPVKDMHLVAQFDGSCHVQEGIGGAGGVIWSPGPVPIILDTIAIPLQPCPDSMFAEIHAAEATLDKALNLAARNQIEEVVIQGDCINIVKHFAGALRLHREDLVRKLGAMWQKLTHTSITVHWSYVPRIGNKVADHLAGIAADSIRFEAILCEDVFFDSGEGQPNMQINTAHFPARPAAVQAMAFTGYTIGLNLRRNWIRLGPGSSSTESHHRIPKDDTMPSVTGKRAKGYSLPGHWTECH